MKSSVCCKGTARTKSKEQGGNPGNTELNKKGPPIIRAALSLLDDHHNQSDNAPEKVLAQSTDLITCAQQLHPEVQLHDRRLR